MSIDRDPTLEPDFAEAYRLDEEGQPREAEQAFLSALSRHPDYAHGWVSLGILRRLKLDDASGAADCFRRVVELCPTEVDVGVSLFHALLDTERYAEAKAEARRLLGLHDEGSAQVHRDHVEALRDWVNDNGDLEREDARLHRVGRMPIEDVERALATAPDRGELLKDLAYGEHPNAPDFVARDLRSENPETRAGAVRALGVLVLDEESHVERIVESLRDVDPEVRCAALFALVGSDAGAGFAMEVQACLDDGDEAVRAGAARALGVVGAEAHRALLEARLSSEPSEVGRIGFLEGLYELTGERRYSDAIVEHLRAPVADVRAYASVVLSRVATRDNAHDVAAAVEAAIAREADRGVRALMKKDLDRIRTTSRERR